jgi:hypothetical protein
MAVNFIQVVYSWSATRGGNAVTLPAAAVGAKNLRLDPVDLVSFVRAVPYVFTLTAFFANSPEQSSSSLVRGQWLLSCLQLARTQCLLFCQVMIQGAHGHL